MKALLFRRMEIDGKNYYQLYKLDEDFKNDSTFADFNNRNSKEFFYLTEDEANSINEISIYNIYSEKDNKLEEITSPSLFIKVFVEFKNKYHISIREIKSIEEIVNEVKKEIMFQDDTVYELVNQIYLNQQIMTSNLPRELKIKLKNNILFHGLYGSGKKTIVRILEKNLDIPYADVSMSSSIKDTFESIIEQLLERSNNSEEASNGIVFIHDNYAELSKVLEKDPFSIVNFMTSQGVISYGENKIDFQKLTFVVLFDEYYNLLDDDIDISDIRTMTNCLYDVSTKILSDKEKFIILKSDKGRIAEYRKFLNSYGKDFHVSDSSLKKLITSCSKVDMGMNILNNIIDGIVKVSIINGVDDVYIDSKCVKDFVPAFTRYEEKKDNDKIENKKEAIINNELKDVFAKVTANVIGQDAAVKRIIYTILENRRMAKKENLDNPKQYIQNILLRGESGSGKTLILETIAKILNIPIFIEDATQYTEQGYYGASVSDMLVHLYHEAGDNLEEAEKGILVIDEGDKKANGNNDKDVSRGAVLDGLLKIVEGAVIPINIGTRPNESEVMFDTSRLTVICSGAFENLEKYRDKRVGKMNIGFANNNSNKIIDNEITDDDYVAFGMRKQFMARFPVIINLVKNTKESLIRIMKDSNLSALKIEKFKLEDKGIQVEFQEDFYEKLAEYALQMNIGARGIKKAFERVLTNIHIENIDEEEVQKIIFTGETINNPNSIILVPREKIKKLKK